MDELLERYAELCVRVGANVQPDQELFVESNLEHAPLTRAIARHAYSAGAAYVNVLYLDDHVRHAMIDLGPDAALTHAPEWRKAWIESANHSTDRVDQPLRIAIRANDERHGAARISRVHRELRLRCVELRFHLAR